MQKSRRVRALLAAGPWALGAGIASIAASPATAQELSAEASAAVDADPTPAESSAAAPLPTIPLAAEKPAPVAVDKRKRDDDDMGEVIVTAQKREERLQDVPVAVTVIGKKQLEQQNISTTGDLTRAAPAVELYGEPGNPETRFSIRGISTNSFSATAEQAVSFVADGVVLGRAPAVSLFDIAQVEVLRGPQGTLFGKNSSAGVISITTNKPDPSQFEAKLHADLGNEYDYRLLQGMVNIPVGDTAALRVSAGQTYQSGFIHNNITDQDSESNIKGGRARFMWDITPDLRVNIIADYEKAYVSEQLYLLFDRYVDEKTGEPQQIKGCGAYANDSMRITCNGHPTNNTNEIWGVSGQIDWTVGDHTITSITSARRYQQDGTIDVDGMPGMYYDNGNKFDNKVYSQELRVASPSGDWIEYVAGIYGSKAHVPNYLQQNIGDDMLASILSGTLPVTLCATFGICFNGQLAQLQNPNNYIADLRSIAAFGQVTMRFFDDWRFIMGARETRDEVEMTSTSYLGVLVAGQPVVPALIPLNDPLKGEDTVNNFSWKLGLQYDVTPVSMAYFTASRGYKGPQVVFNPPGIIPTIDGLVVRLPAKASISIVNPEYPMDYELGFKTLLWGGFYANLNLFHTAIKDYQSSVFNAQGTFTPNNIDNVTTQGVELDFFGAPFKGFTINGGFMWNKVVYPDYYVTCTQDGPQCGDNPQTPDEEDNVENIKGKQLVGAPEWKYTLAAEYEHSLLWGISGFLGADAVYRSNIHFMASTDTRTDSGSHTIIGARTGLRSKAQGWQLSLFVRNLFDERYAQFKFAPYLFADAASPGIDTSGQALSTESFRFIGLTLDINL